MTAKRPFDSHDFDAAIARARAAVRDAEADRARMIEAAMADMPDSETLARCRAFREHGARAAAALIEAADGIEAARHASTS